MTRAQLRAWLWGISLILLICVALPPASAWAQGPKLRLLDVPSSGRSYRYQELSAAGGFAISIANDDLTQSVTATATIIDPWPCNGGDDDNPAQPATGSSETTEPEVASLLCASELFTVPDPKEIEPGESERFDFKWTKPDRLLKSGTYSMLLVIESDPPGKVVDASLSIEVLPFPLYARLVEMALGLQTPIERAKDLLPLAVMAAIACVVFCYLRAHCRRSNLGTVRLEVQDKTALKDETLEPDFVAQVKDRLDNLGIMPPEAQPAASLAMDVAMDLVSVTGASATSPISKLLALMTKVFSPAVAHTAECTLLGSMSSLRAMVEVKATKTGSCYGIEILEAGTRGQLALKASCYIYLQVFNQRQKGWAPKWQQFSSVEAMVSYQEAMKHRRDCLTAGGNDGSGQKAEDAFRKAAHRDPGNLVPRMALAAQLTINEKFEDAIALYGEIVDLYPDLIEPRYRFEAGKSMNPPTGCQVPKNPYRDVQRRLSARHCLWKWLQHRDERGYWTIWVPWHAPWRCERLRFKRMVDLAHYCREMLDLAGNETPFIEELEKEIRLFNPTVRREEVETLIWKVDADVRHEEAEKLIRKVDAHVRQEEVEKLIGRVGAAAASVRRKEVMELIRRVDAMVRPTRGRYKDSASVGLRHAFSYWTKPLVFPNQWGMNSWRARYNAACFYAIALRVESDDELKNHCVRTALEQLTRAMTDPDGIDAWRWIEHDPDLKKLRAAKQYKLWKKHYLHRQNEPCPEPQYS